MSSPYRSPTRRLRAEARLDNGSRLAGDVHLHPNTLAPGGYETARRLMNEDAPFFPLSTEKAGVVLVGKSRTVSLTYERSHEAAEPVDDAARSALTLELLLSDGRSLVGQARVEMPSAYPRVLDLMNGSDPFISIRDETHVHLVNRAHIRTVHPRD